MWGSLGMMTRRTRKKRKTQRAKWMRGTEECRRASDDAASRRLEISTPYRLSAGDPQISLRQRRLQINVDRRWTRASPSVQCTHLQPLP